MTIKIDRFFYPVRLALDIVLPPRCLRCGAVTGTAHGVCASCFGTIRFLEAATQCSRCAMPFESPGQGGEHSCEPDHDRILDRVRAATLYDDGTRSMILAFKHADRTDMARGLAVWLARVSADMLNEADVVIPVPLHRWRLLWRRYNQSALLARALVSFQARALYCPVLLQRVRATRTQGHFDRIQRHNNVAGAFHVALRYRARLAGRRVLLVDDVMTTGATLRACASALRDAGAGPVDAVVLARAMGPGL